MTEEKTRLANIQWVKGEENWPSITLSTRCYRKEPLSHFRWLVKKSGEKVLQQAYSVTTDIREYPTIEYFDVETVEEE